MGSTSLVGLAIVVLAQDGPSEGYRFGSDAVGVGDVDGDGHGDVVAVTNRVVESGDVEEALCFSGATGEVLHALSSARSALGGKSLCRVADLDGDGRDEVAIGTWSPARAEERAGRITVFSGADGSVLLELRDDAGPSRTFAFELASADCDGDGTADIVVGSPPRRARTDPVPGRVDWYSGRTGERLGGVEGRVADGATNNFGARLCVLGDADGDGAVEVAIGAPRYFEGAGLEHGRALPGIAVVCVTTGTTKYRREGGYPDLGHALCPLSLATTSPSGALAIASRGRVVWAIDWLDDEVPFVLNTSNSSERLGFGQSLVYLETPAGHPRLLVGHDESIRSSLPGGYGIVVYSPRNGEWTLDTRLREGLPSRVSAAGDANDDGVHDYLVGDPVAATLELRSGADDGVIRRFRLP